jgi:hypothetical protein
MTTTVSAINPADNDRRAAREGSPPCPTIHRLTARASNLLRTTTRAGVVFGIVVAVHMAPRSAMGRDVDDGRVGKGSGQLVSTSELIWRKYPRALVCHSSLH